MSLDSVRNMEVISSWKQAGGVAECEVKSDFVDRLKAISARNDQERQQRVLDSTVEMQQSHANLQLREMERQKEAVVRVNQVLEKILANKTQLVQLLERSANPSCVLVEPNDHEKLQFLVKYVGDQTVQENDSCDKLNLEQLEAYLLDLIQLRADLEAGNGDVARAMDFLRILIDKSSASDSCSPAQTKPAAESAIWKLSDEWTDLDDSKTV